VNPPFHRCITLNHTPHRPIPGHRRPECGTMPASGSLLRPTLMCERTVPSKTIDLNRLTDEPTWPTKRQDVLAALAIIQRHTTRTGEPLRLLDGWSEAAPDHLWVQFPDWLLDLGRHYRAQLARPASRFCSGCCGSCCRSSRCTKVENHASGRRPAPCYDGSTQPITRSRGLPHMCPKP
jgi:hypothetical protein